MRILVINPGSTSTKIAVYEGAECLFSHSIVHTPEQLSSFNDVIEEYPFRQEMIKKELEAAGFSLHFDVVMGRGGVSRAIPGGVYEVNDLMVEHARTATRRHACNLGCIMARDMALLTPGCRAFIADPGSTDELYDYARVTGSPLMPRHCIWHALNQRAIARRFARETGCEYEDLNLIICHLGGGISVVAHEKGRAVDANNALEGDGPFSPERSGSLPVTDLINLCYDGQVTRHELLKRVKGRGGMSAHLGTNDVREVLRRIDEGDDHARLVLEAMLYQTSKAIAGLGATLRGKVDAILLTGGIAHSERITDYLRSRIDWIAPTYCYPGEDEMEALALNAVDVLENRRTPKVYDFE